MAALLASALAGVLVAATLAGRYAFAAAVALTQALLLLGMVRSTDVPARRAGAAVALAAGLAGGWFVLERSELAPPTDLAPLLVAAGSGFVALVVVQLWRRDGRERLTESLSLGVASLLLVVTTAAWVGIGEDEPAATVLLLALAGVAIGGAFGIFPGPRPLWVVPAAVGAAGAGLLLEDSVGRIGEAGLSPVATAVTTGACAAAGVAGLWVADLVRRDREQAAGSAPGPGSALLTATLPLGLAAAVAYGLAWAVVDGALS